MKLEDIEKIFANLPKLFDSRLKPAIYNDQYLFYLNKGIIYDVIVNDNEECCEIDTDKVFQKAYKNKFIGTKYDAMITYGDLNAFPTYIKTSILKNFYHNLNRLFKKNMPLRMASFMPHNNVKSIVFNSIEDMLIKIDMFNFE